MYLLFTCMNVLIFYLFETMSFYTNENVIQIEKRIKLNSN